MNIVVDIGHPAHVHFFKHFIWQMEAKGHRFLITASDKDVARQLLDNYGLSYEHLGGYGRSMLAKVFSVAALDLRMWSKVRRFRPDALLGIASVRAAHVGAMLRRPSFIFDDTEQGRAEVLLYKPFASAICSPACYLRDLGRRHRRYQGYQELAYLHPTHYRPDPTVLDLLPGEGKYTLLRFVSWEAVHDVGHEPMPVAAKIALVEKLRQHVRVFISAEGALPRQLEQHRVDAPPERMHDVLAHAALFIGEGATMASECAVLGTPAIAILDAALGYLKEQRERYECVFQYPETTQGYEAAVEKGLELLQDSDTETAWAEKRRRILSEKIDVTEWMMDLVEGELG